MFERFTDQARRVVVLAQEEARLVNHGYIGTEHLLLALVGQPESAAGQVLASLGLDLDDVRERVARIAEPGSLPPSGHIPFTPRAKSVLELSMREALQLGHQEIRTEHLLLGLVREGTGVAGQVLVELCGDLSTVRQRTIEWLSQHAGDPPTEVAAPVTNEWTASPWGP